MLKTQFDKFVSTLESAGITNYNIRCEGGNRIFYHNGTSGLIYRFNDYVICIDLCRNILHTNGQYDIALVPYENIDDIKSTDIPLVEAINIMDSLGCKDEEFLKFVRTTPRLSNTIPGTAGLAPEKDKNGNDVISGPVAGYSTK